MYKKTTFPEEIPVIFAVFSENDFAKSLIHVMLAKRYGIFYKSRYT